MRKRKGDDLSQLTSNKKARLKQKQTFLPSYEKDFKWVRQSRRDNHSVSCIYCFTDINIGHGGRHDIEKHEATDKHVKNARLSKQTTLITSMCAKPDLAKDRLDMDVMRAEATFAILIAKLNLPISSADSFTSALKSSVTDSKIISKYQCGRSKTTAIINKLARDTKDILIKQMKTGPFSLSTDGSNDDKSKQFPLVVRTIGEDGKVTSQLLSIPVVHGSATGEAISRVIESAMEKDAIPWTNCISFGCDNANVMVGLNKGVYKFMKNKHGEIHLSGCALHLVHIAAEKAANTLPVAIDEVLIDIFYYMKKSSKRLYKLGVLQAMHDVDQKKMLKHVCTRWLSIDRCLARLIENWAPLYDFFKSEVAEMKKKAVMRPAMSILKPRK